MVETHNPGGSATASAEKSSHGRPGGGSPEGLPAPAKRRRRQPGATSGSARMAALLVSPTLLVLTIVVLYPTIVALKDSLYGQAGLDPETGFVSKTEPFVGMDNYADIFFGEAGSRFWNAFWNTSFFTVTTVIMETVIGVAMALIMHKAFKGRALVRASILIPWAIPTAISAILWRWIFNSDGIANKILGDQILWTT